MGQLQVVVRATTEYIYIYMCVYIYTHTHTRIYMTEQVIYFRAGGYDRVAASNEEGQRRLLMNEKELT